MVPCGHWNGIKTPSTHCAQSSPIQANWPAVHADDEVEDELVLSEEEEEDEEEEEEEEGRE